MSTPPPTRYPLFSRFLHWLMAILLLGMVILGYYMKSLPMSPVKFQLYSWHKWTGISVLTLVVVRLLWRYTHRLPSLPHSMSVISIWAAKIGHLFLYSLMLAIPITGWLMSSAKGIPTVMFGLYPLPDLISKNKELGNTLVTVHIWLNYALITMVIAHVMAALKHQFIDRDRIFSRITLRFTPEKKT